MSKTSTGRRSTRLRATPPPSEGASPELGRRKRTRVRSGESSPAKKKMTTAEESQKELLAAIQGLNKRFDEVPNKQDLNQLEVSIRSRINDNTKEISRMRAEQLQDRNNLPRVVKRILSEEMSKGKGARTGQPPMTKDEQDKEKSYLLARRSMRMWPVKVTPEAVSYTHLTLPTIYSV